MAPQTRGKKRQLTTTKDTTTISPQTRGGGGGKGKSRKRQTTTKATTTRGGEGGRTTKETTTTSNENLTIDEEEEGNIQDYEEEQLSDDESYLPAKETVLADCYRQKEELKEESKIKLKSLITYLEKMGMPAAQTLKLSIRQLIEGSLDPTKRDLISKQIIEYITLRWRKTRRIFSHLLQISVWDGKVVRMVYELSKDLKDLPVHVPKIEDIASDAAYVLKAKEGWLVRMAKELQYDVALWLRDTMHWDEMVKEWAKCPTWTIVMKKPGEWAKCPTWTIVMKKPGGPSSR